MSLSAHCPVVLTVLCGRASSALAPGNSSTAPTGSWRSWSAWRRGCCSSGRLRRCPLSAAPAPGRRMAPPGWPAASRCLSSAQHCPSARQDGGRRLQAGPQLAPVCRCRLALPVSRVCLPGRRTAPAGWGASRYVLFAAHMCCSALLAAAPLAPMRKSLWGLLQAVSSCNERVLQAVPLQDFAVSHWKKSFHASAL